MAIEVKPETERLMSEEMRSGHFANIDDLIVQSVIAWREQHQGPAMAPKRSAAEAVAHIRELRQGLTLNGLKIKNLVNEGRR